MSTPTRPATPRRRARDRDGAGDRRVTQPSGRGTRSWRAGPTLVAVSTQRRPGGVGVYDEAGVERWPDALASARLHVVTGKGGTGKSTLAASLALALAAGGGRTLLVEVEGRQGIAQLFDTPPLPYAEQRDRGGPRRRRGPRRSRSTPRSPCSSTSRCSTTSGSPAGRCAGWARSSSPRRSRPASATSCSPARSRSASAARSATTAATAARAPRSTTPSSSTRRPRAAS